MYADRPAAWVATIALIAPALLAATNMSKHSIVWLDHQEAHVYHVQPDAFSETSVRAPAHHLRRHPKGATEAKAHPEDAKHFFDDVAKALEDAVEVLVVGPGTAKLHFLKYVHKHQHALESRIFGVETVDHPTDKQLAAYAKHYFTAADRMR
jgi:stalled ribosome rescue protein Dom34